MVLKELHDKVIFKDDARAVVDSFGCDLVVKLLESTDSGVERCTIAMIKSLVRYESTRLAVLFASLLR
jgi:hypothetical protein